MLCIPFNLRPLLFALIGVAYLAGCAPGSSLYLLAKASSASVGEPCQGCSGEVADYSTAVLEFDDVRLRVETNSHLKIEDSVLVGGMVPVRERLSEEQGVSGQTLNILVEALAYSP